MEEISQIKQRYGSYKNKISANARKKRFEDLASQARQTSEKVWTKTSTFVKENPGLAIGIALLGGAVIGSLISRSWPSGYASFQDALPQPARKTVQQAEKKVLPSIQRAEASVGQKMVSLRSFLNKTLHKFK